MKRIEALSETARAFCFLHLSILFAGFTGIFGKPNQIFASEQGDNVWLELVTKSKPHNIGVLELRKEGGVCSIV